ncbi:MAG TPA: hypothetical protein VF188_16835, partial [Longimicrobiales bacterium]
MGHGKVAAGLAAALLVAAAPPAVAQGAKPSAVAQHVAPPAVAQDAERALAIAREVERVAADRTLWPGFDPLAIPLAIYAGGRTYLFRHPSPPEGFTPLVGAEPEATVFEGRHPSVVGNTSAGIGGVMTATLLADAAPGESRG